MGQMTWRVPDELLGQVRRQASERGRSLNEWVTEVMRAVTDPDNASSESARVRERLRRAGLLDGVEPRGRRRPPAKKIAAARAAAGAGTSLADLVSKGRG